MDGKDAVETRVTRQPLTLDSLKEVDRFVDDQAPGGNPKPGGRFQTIWVRVFSRLALTLAKSFAGKAKASGAVTTMILKGEINLAIQLKSGTIFWPMQRIMKRIKNGPEEGIYVYGITMK